MSSTAQVGPLLSIGTWGERTMRRLLRYSLRGLLVLTTFVALLLGWRMSTVRACERALALLDQAKVRYELEETSAASFWDRIPALRARRVVGLNIYYSPYNHTGSEPFDSLGRAVKIMARHSRVEEVRLGVATWGAEGERDLTKLLEACALLKSVRILRIEGPVGSVESVRSVAEFSQLEEFGCWGSCGSCEEEALRFVARIPTVKRIGLMQGGFLVPEDVLAQRPDIKYFQTDFPP